MLASGTLTLRFSLSADGHALFRHVVPPSPMRRSLLKALDSPSSLHSRPEAVISVLMPCLNPGPYVWEAVDSILADPAVLELVVADGGSCDGTLEMLRRRQESDGRLRLVSQQDQGPADALNRALSRVRGTVIGWLNADDRYLPGAPSRALQALQAHPDWLMVYGEGEHINAAGDVLDRYPTRQPDVGLQGFCDYCYICQPTVFWRHSMSVMLGGFDCSLQTCFDFAYWIRVFQMFPDRVGFVPVVQAQTRRHDATISVRQLPRAVLEATLLQARLSAGVRPHMLQGYLDQIRSGALSIPKPMTPLEHVRQLQVWMDDLEMPSRQRQDCLLLLDHFLQSLAAADDLASEAS